LPPLAGRLQRARVRAGVLAGLRPRRARRRHRRVPAARAPLRRSRGPHGILIVPADQGLPGGSTGSPAAAGSDLGLRTASGFVMAVLALGTAWLGGWVFVVFWAGAAVLILWEWSTLALASARRVPWIAVGIVYAGAAFAAPVVLRSDPDAGFRAI